MSSDPAFPPWAPPAVVPELLPEQLQQVWAYLLQHPLPSSIRPGGAYMGAREAITGRVNSDGTRAAGTGFEVSRSALGIYQVTYSSAFRNEPIVSLGLLSAPLVSTNPVVYAFDAHDSTGFTIHWKTTAADQDVNWMFSALTVPN